MEWRKLHNEELNDLYSSHCCSGDQFEDKQMDEACSTYGRGRVFWWENLRKREHLEDPGVCGKIILRWIFREWGVGAWTGSSWLWIETGGGHL
jgi:hypothetical protein